MTALWLKRGSSLIHFISNLITAPARGPRFAISFFLQVQLKQCDYFSLAPATRNICGLWNLCLLNSKSGWWVFKNPPPQPHHHHNPTTTTTPPGCWTAANTLWHHAAGSETDQHINSSGPERRQCSAGCNVFLLPTAVPTWHNEKQCLFVSCAIAFGKVSGRI